VQQDGREVRIINVSLIGGAFGIGAGDGVEERLVDNLGAGACGGHSAEGECHVAFLKVKNSSITAKENGDG
jgi:hypothetical protein